MKPDSFCTICTFPCHNELIGLLLSLSIHHPNEKMYCLTDTKTKEVINKISPKIKLDIKFIIDLDKYSDYNRAQMTNKGMWTNFQMEKASVIEYALEKSLNTLFLDSDIIILDKIDDIDLSKQLGVSPQWIKKIHLDETGFYNGGMLWTNQKTLPNKWREFTKTSRYFDQASIENLTKMYETFIFSENYNLQCWRLTLSDKSSETIASYIKSDKTTKNITYKGQNLKFIHTHFDQTRFQTFNNLIISHLLNVKRYKELLCIQKTLNTNWIIEIPQQPKQGLFRHMNDSFRELCYLLGEKNKDVQITTTKSDHIWLKPNILLYDRPTLEWINPEVMKSTLFLLGNGDIKEEGDILKKKELNVKPWIFWPRQPKILEKTLHEEGILSFEKRTVESIFIGNFENPVQKKYRIDNVNNTWKDVIEEYYCTAGKQHKFSQKDYLMKLRNSKYGFCLRGYGSKCHREVELMAFGTIPIITSNVSIDSYWDPPIENQHFIRIQNPDELKQKISDISEEKWTAMSKNCQEWYMKNIHSDHCWETMITRIFYE